MPRSINGAGESINDFAGNDSEFRGFFRILTDFYGFIGGKCAMAWAETDKVDQVSDQEIRLKQPILLSETAIPRLPKR